MAIVVKRSLSGSGDYDLSPAGKMIALGPSNGQMNGKWGKICSIRFSKHQQGQFTYLKVFIGYGNNGTAGQCAYFDMFGQLGWTGNYGGRAGWMVVLHPCSSSFTTSNIYLKVIANSNIDYDIWFKADTNWVVPNVLFFPSVSWRYGEVTAQSSCTVYDPVWISTDPSGTECALALISESKD